MSVKTIGDGFLSITGIGASSTGTISGGLTATGTVNLPSTTNIAGTSLATTLAQKANIASPTFTGIVNLPSSVTIGGTPVDTLIGGASGSTSMSFGTATLSGTDTLIIPFRNVENTADLSIGTNYHPIITVDAVTETLPNPSNLYLFTGTVNADFSGNSRNLTITSGTTIGTDLLKGGIITLTAGKLAYAITDYVTWTSGNGYTLSFDFKYTTTGTYTQILRVGERHYTSGMPIGSSLGTRGVGFEVTSGNCRLMFGRGGGYVAIGNTVFGAGFISNTWYHIDIIFKVGAISDTNPELYINNTLIAGNYNGITSGGITITDVLQIGNSTHPEYGTTNKDPSFANLRVTPTILTALQRAVLVSNTGISPLTTQIVARNTNNVQFKILNRAFGYMPIVANKASLNINATIVDGASIKASTNIPVSHLT